MDILVTFFLLGSSYLSWGLALSCWTLGKSNVFSFMGILGIFFLDMHLGSYFFLFVLLFSWMLLIVDKKETGINFYLKFFVVLFFVFLTNKIIYGFFNLPGSSLDVLRSFAVLWMFDRK